MPVRRNKRDQIWLQMYVLIYQLLIPTVTQKLVI